MRKLTMFLLLQVMFFSVNAQFSLRGTVSGNGEKLAGASVVIENTFYGTSTDAYGNFSFNNLKAGDYKLKVSFIGYITKTQSVSVNGDKHISLNLTSDVVMADEVIVKATRAGEKSPFAWNNVSKEEITDRNMGQDIPYLMQLTPSFVTTSDAGAGVGYTNFRIRGTDLNRVNVTVNGIPLNDAESHGTWFVDQPDLASSLENIQIQRGVGTSTNGAAAFGATINLQTNTLHKEPYAKYSTAFGSFNTLKNTVSAGTGLINDNFTFDARLSKVSSDGFIDRASSDLKSFFVSGGYYSAKTIMKINVFSGFEETYQAWNGIPSVRLKNDLEGMKRYGEHGLYTPEETQAMIDADSRTYNLYTYKNQVDHYQQNHYQLFISHKFSNTLNVNLAGHFTHGEGYYENYKKEKKLADYLIPDIILEDQSIKRSDLINRKWLDNNFYGFTFSAIHKKNTREFTFGGGWNKYDGNHFGQVIWGQYLGKIDKNHEWYRGKGIKNDANLFAKYNVEVSKKINLFADMQFRTINYTITGIDDDLRNIAQEHKFNFFNPKLGIFYQPSTNQDVFASFAVAHREPNRANYVDADPNGKQAVQEILFDWEAGYTLKTRSVSAGANLYFMDYKNQLVLTGEINDVGSPIMVNVDKSYRAGIELQAGWKISNMVEWNANATFSTNKIKNFTEYVDDWDNGGQKTTELGTTNIAFSPNVIASSLFSVSPLDKMRISFVSSFVDKQYIDNSGSDDRMIDAYFVNNLLADYSFTTKLFSEITLHAQVNNIFNEMYETNAWVYSYILGGERYKMDGYYPQAGIHFMFGVDFRF